MTRSSAFEEALLAIGVVLAIGLGGCASYHQEVAALRMARPRAEPAALAAYAAPQRAYPSVGGDVLAGTSPASTAAFDASAGDDPPPAR